jgi:hypothetical protein
MAFKAVDTVQARYTKFQCPKRVATQANTLTKINKNVRYAMEKLTKLELYAASKTNFFPTRNPESEAVTVFATLQTFTKHLIAAKVCQFQHAKIQGSGQMSAMMNTLLKIHAKSVQDFVQIQTDAPTEMCFNVTKPAETTLLFLQILTNASHVIFLVTDAPFLLIIQHAFPAHKAT